MPWLFVYLLLDPTLTPSSVSQRTDPCTLFANYFANLLWMRFGQLEAPGEIGGKWVEFISQDCYYRLSQTQFWRLTVWNQGVGRATLPPKARILPCLSQLLLALEILGVPWLITKSLQSPSSHGLLPYVSASSSLLLRTLVTKFPNKVTPWCSRWTWIFEGYSLI